MGVGDDAFDIVLCGFGILLLPSAAAALAEWRRVPRPGGTLGLSTWDSSADARWAWESARARVRHAAAGACPHHRLDAGTLHTADKLADALIEAGFEQVRTDVAWIERHYEGAEESWKWTQSHGHRVLSDNLGEADAARFRERGLDEFALAFRGRPAGRRFTALLSRATSPS